MIVTRYLAIEFDDRSSITCQSTALWTGTVTADEVILEGKIEQRAAAAGGTTVCDPVDDTFYRRGTHDGERFTIEFNYESTPIKLTGNFNDIGLYSSYYASWTGVLAGWGEMTKSEEAQIDLAITP